MISASGIEKSDEAPTWCRAGPPGDPPANSPDPGNPAAIAAADPRSWPPAPGWSRVRGSTFAVTETTRLAVLARDRGIGPASLDLGDLEQRHGPAIGRADQQRARYRRLGAALGFGRRTRTSSPRCGPPAGPAPRHRKRPRAPAGPLPPRSGPGERPASVRLNSSCALPGRENPSSASRTGLKSARSAASRAAAAASTAGVGVAPAGSPGTCPPDRPTTIRTGTERAEGIVPSALRQARCEGGALAWAAISGGAG